VSSLASSLELFVASTYSLSSGLSSPKENFKSELPLKILSLEKGFVSTALSPFLAVSVPKAAKLNLLEVSLNTLFD
jgi:hypothetical protein